MFPGGAAGAGAGGSGAGAAFGVGGSASAVIGVFSGEAGGVPTMPAPWVIGSPYRFHPLHYEKLKRAKVPVFAMSRCGHDRDCLSDDRWVPSLGEAIRNAYGYTHLGSGRFVDILDRPGGNILSHIQGSNSDYVQFTPNNYDEAELRAIQTSPNAGRFGFLPQ